MSGKKVYLLIATVCPEFGEWQLAYASWTKAEIQELIGYCEGTEGVALAFPGFYCVECFLPYIEVRSAGKLLGHNMSCPAIHKLLDADFAYEILPEDLRLKECARTSCLTTHFTSSGVLWTWYSGDLAYETVLLPLPLLQQLCDSDAVAEPVTKEAEHGA